MNHVGQLCVIEVKLFLVGKYSQTLSLEGYIDSGVSRLWTHENLNEETHSQLELFLGGTSIRSLDWLMKSGSVESVTTNAPAFTELATPENIKRLKGIPILFLSGSENMVFTAENTDTSYTTLCNAHGRNWYEREVFHGRGHLDAWMGPTACGDVYPRVKRHIDTVLQRQEI